MGAGVLVRKYQTKNVAAISGGLDLLPWSGPLLLMAVLALAAMPPFGIFRSEFQIVAGGFSASKNVAAAVLIVAVTLAFLGLSLTANRMLMTPPATRLMNPPAKRLTRGEPSVWMVAPVVAGVVALALLGVHPPAHLTELLARGAAELRGLR
jgi:hydrogenase-4 component F